MTTCRKKFLATDARTMRDDSTVFSELRRKLIEQEQQGAIEAEQELAARREREERSRLAQLEIERDRLAAERARPATYSRNSIVQPSDWTDADDALENAMPISWLQSRGPVRPARNSVIGDCRG